MTGIPFDQRDGWIWMDGNIHPWREAKTHVINHGLHYGGSVFEGLRMYGGKIFKLGEHTDRLIRSAATIGMPVPYTPDELNRATQDIVIKNGLENAYIRPFAWRGSEEMGIGASHCSTHVAIACWSWDNYFGGIEGISLRTSPWRKPNPETAPTTSKCAALYVIGTMAKHESVKHGYTDALMLDYRGYVAESTGANIFMVKDGQLLTPVADCFLNGITRQTVIQMAGDNGLTVEETRITPDDILKADEVFVTGTAAEITPVNKIDSTIFPVGSVTLRLRTLYHELVLA